MVSHQSPTYNSSPPSRAQILESLISPMVSGDPEGQMPHKEEEMTQKNICT